jgi:membrane protein required for colicin V production
MSLAFTFIDVIVIVVVLVSAVYATWKGFISETLAIVAWAAAAFATLYFGAWAGEWLRGLISSPWLRMIAAYAAVFIVVFVPLSIVSLRLGERVRHSPVGPLDRALGATYGVVRGLAVVGLAYLVFTAFVPIRSQPDWLATARTLPLIQSSSELLLALIPIPRDDVAPAPSKKAQTLEKLLAEPSPAAPPETPGSGKKGYGIGDRRALDRLLEATGNGGTGKP